jgi:hypothetical protein
MPKLMRYEPPRAKQSRFIHGVDDDTIGEEMRLFLAFQVAMQNLNALVEDSRKLDGGGRYVAISDGAYQHLRAFIADCATGREL